MSFGAKDGPADLIFFIAAPDGADQEHLKLLSTLARSLMKKSFTASLREAQTPEEIVDLVNDALGTGAPKKAPPTRQHRTRKRRVQAHPLKLQRHRPTPQKRLHPRSQPPRRSWRSPPAPPASRTPIWRRMPSNTLRKTSATTSRSRPRGPRGTKPSPSRY